MANYDDIIVNIEMPNFGIPIYLYDGQKRIATFHSRFTTSTPTLITNFYAQTYQFKKYKDLSIIYDTRYGAELNKYIISSNIFMGSKHFYFNSAQIENFEIKNTEINHKKYYQIVLPESIKKIQNSEYMNYKGIYNSIAIVFLSFFYSIKLYITAWIFLIIGISMLEFEQLKIPTGLFLFVITLTAIFLRFNLLTEYPMWWDECYTATLTGDFMNPFEDLFMDAGNPPFFALISRLWQGFVPQTIKWLRLLPLIFSIGSIFTLYFVIKEKINKKTALLASFLLSISIFHISYAQDYRAFSLSCLLTPFVAYFMFKMLEKMNFLNIFLFILFSSMIFNNHLYGTILLIVNFLYGIWYIITKYNNKQKPLLIFIFAHLIVGLTFLPYFFHTFLQRAILDKTFNTWLPDMCFEVFLRALRAMFGNWQVALGVLVLSILFIIFSKINKDIIFSQMEEKQREFVYYLIYATYGFLVVNIIISSIRAIIMEYYFMLIYPLCIALIAVIFMINWRYKFINIILSFMLLYTVSHMDYNNLRIQFQNVYGSLTQVSNSDALRYSKNNVLVYELIEPTSFRKLFILEPNITVQTDFNGGNKDFTKYTKKVRRYAKKNTTQFAIFNAWYEEVTHEDIEIFEKGNFEYIAEFIKTPYYINSGILRVILLPTK